MWLCLHELGIWRDGWVGQGGLVVKGMLGSGAWGGVEWVGISWWFEGA